jgi:hypothetical protein
MLKTKRHSTRKTLQEQMFCRVCLYLMSLLMSIFISVILHCPWFCVHFRWSPQKLKIQISVCKISNAKLNWTLDVQKYVWSLFALCHAEVCSAVVIFAFPIVSFNLWFLICNDLFIRTCLVALEEHFLCKAQDQLWLTCCNLFLTIRTQKGSPFLLI